MNVFSYGLSALKIGSLLSLDSSFFSFMESYVVVKICETTSIVGTTAGVISSIAYFVFRQSNYFVYSIATLPLGLISWYYVSKYQVVTEELKDREIIEAAADRMDQEGDEIRGAVSKLEQEIGNLRASKAQLESQVCLLTTSNTELSEALVAMKEENKILGSVKEKLTEDLAVLENLEKKIQEHATALAENVQQVSEQSALGSDKLQALGADVKSRLERIASIYDKLKIVNALQVELVEIAHSDRGRAEFIFKEVPTLKNVLELNLLD